MTLAAKIRAYHPDVAPIAIAREIGCSPRYVSQVRCKDRRRLQRKAQARQKRQRQIVATPLVVLPAADPRWAAWLQHWRNIGDHPRAAHVERMRHAITAPTDWPPESSEVTCRLIPFTRETIYEIPHGTPEWASHAAALRRGDRNQKACAQAMELAKRTITPRARWGKVEGDKP